MSHRIFTATLAAAATLAAVLAASGSGAATRSLVPAYVPDQVVVGYASPSMAARITHATRLSAASSPEPGVEVLRVPRATGVARAIDRLKSMPGVRYAVPNYIAHTAGTFIPNDPGNTHTPGGWQKMQWNFLAGAGVDAPTAWGNLIADGAPGGRGVVVAVLDTGVAYRNWHQFAQSPDFTTTKFVSPYDFVANNAYPLDREGHGTFVAGEIAEATNNGVGLTGLAYGATIMPVRVLASSGSGDAATIARAIRYAVTHGAQVVNLSLEFGLGIQSSDIPEILSAIDFAHARGVVVVGAGGNDQSNQLAYPARAPYTIAVGATTSDRCAAWYSNTGSGLTLVAPGGGDDAALPSDPMCQPARNLPPIRQLTFLRESDPRRFGYPGGYYGTSMASAEVAAAAALVIASRVLGAHPTPAQILRRLEQTATPLGGSAVPNDIYGYGLINAGAATAGTPSG